MYALPEGLSQYSDKIYQLCLSNPEFAGLYSEFDKVRGEVERIMNAPNTMPDYLVNLKKSQTYLQGRLVNYLHD